MNTLLAPALDLEQWLRDHGRRLEPGCEAPRGVTIRLRFIAGLLEELEAPLKTPALVFRRPGQRASAVRISGELTVGRQAPAQLVFPDRRLSRSHFSICFSAAGHLLEDACSLNGTFINGTRVRSRLLGNGNIIEAGSQVFVFLEPWPLQLAARIAAEPPRRAELPCGFRSLEARLRIGGMQVRPGSP
jgi:pSer/pThr/pTyr-binding forkhead associated (FHA) protein